MSIYIFVKPYDIFMPRGNSHFGTNSGDFGELSLPPAPSLFAGAFRSFIASRNQQDLKAVEKGELPPSPKVAKCLGSLKEPGEFKIGQVALFNKAKKERYFKMPSDLVVFADKKEVYKLEPKPKPACIKFSSAFNKLALLKAPNAKPSGGFWLKEAGYKKYLMGEKIEFEDLIKISSLYKKEMRVGIALDNSTRTTKTGMLYSAEAISFCQNIGFLVEIYGANEVLPQEGEVSLGGDMRAAHFEAVNGINALTMPVKQIEAEKRFKLVLTSPAIFDDGFFLRQKGFKADLACASTAGYQTLSGWNMVLNRPKDALRTAQAGSVYWFENFDGSAQDLCNYAIQGMWGENIDKQRVAEGYNQGMAALW